MAMLLGVQLGLVALTNTPTQTASPNAMDSTFWPVVLGLILTAIITLIVTLLVQSYSSRPKIEGGVFGILQGEYKTQESGMEVHKSFFWPYVYLTNQHQNAVWPLDYEFEADFGEGFVKLERQYGDVTGIFPETISATISSKSDLGNRQLKMQNLSKQLLYIKAKPMEYGDFLHGFVMFSGAQELEARTIVRARFTCIDAFRKRHAFEATQENLLSLALFSELLQIPQE